MKNSPYEPEMIDITVTDGKPSVVRIRRRTFKVAHILNMWRIDEDWWRKPISRLYLLLELNSGTRLTVFRDLTSGSWYMQNYIE
jgi:hypothetical protein